MNHLILQSLLDETSSDSLWMSTEVMHEIAVEYWIAVSLDFYCF